MARFIAYCYDPLTYPETIQISNHAQPGYQSVWEDHYHDAASNNGTAADFAIKLYEHGDRFDAQELKLMARGAFLKAWANIDHKEHSGLNAEEPSFDLEAYNSSKAFMDLIRLVYSTTHFNDRGLRDITFRTMKWHMINHDHYKSNSKLTRQIVEEAHDAAIDLALHTISKVDYTCTERKSEQRFVVYPCPCEFQSPYYRETSCIEARRKRVFCFQCCEFGTFCPDIYNGWGDEED